MLSHYTDKTIEDIMPARKVFFERFWGPVCLAVLNTPSDEAAASLMAPVVREILLQGGRACRPMLATTSLDDTFVAPALAYLYDHPVRFGARVREIDRAGAAPVLRFSGEAVALDPDDVLIVATPPWVTNDLLPDISAPDRYEPIVNAHFRIARENLAPHASDGLQGYIGGTAEWASVRNDILSVTVSAARDLVDLDSDEVAVRLWRDVRSMTTLSSEVPPVRVIKERRATFSQTPEQCTKRPGPGAAGGRVLLAGDWVDTGLPATIEGAVRAGEQAASQACSFIGGGA